MKIAINTVVWGEDYVDALMMHSLPSLLGDENIEGRVDLRGVYYQIMTTREDLPRITSHPMYSLLKTVFTVTIEFIDDITVDETVTTSKYNRVSIAQSQGMERAAEDGASAILFLYPDFIYSGNALQEVLRRVRAGAEGVFCPIPIIEREAVDDGLFADFLVRSSKIPEACSHNIPPRELVKRCMEYPHKATGGFVTEGDFYAEWPGMFMWEVPGEGWLVHSFHLHPIAIRLHPGDPKFNIHFEVSIDDEYVSRVYDESDWLSFIQDSDECAVVSMHGKDEPPHVTPGRRDNVIRTAIWAEEFTGRLLRYFFRIPFRWRYHDVSIQGWAHAEQKFEAFSSRVLRRLNTPDSVLSFEDCDAYAGRMRRGVRFNEMSGLSVQVDR